MRTQTMIHFLALLILCLSVCLIPPPAAAQIAVGVTVRIAPPVLPVYDQPICPGDGYIWVPGYWAWGGGDYYWVPGTWVLAPEPGFLWTPGFWAWGGNGFVFTAGYWGPVVGFYGGINYGFGYFGHGYVGGRWEGRHFYYNRAVSNIDANVIHNTYESRVNNATVNRSSYNGGNGGVTARPTTEEQAAAHEARIGPVAAQTEQEQAARSKPQLRASVNHGVPPVLATEPAGDLQSSRIVAARERGSPSNSAERSASSANPPSSPIHPRDLPPAGRMAAPNTGNAKVDQKYQKQQDELAVQQEKERQKLQKQQDKEDQRLQKQRAGDVKRQETEQRHQQQTEQMVQRHTQQLQDLQQHQQPRASPRPAKPH